MNLRYFTPEEVEGLEPELAVRLDVARGHAGIPFVITSGFRTPEENAAVGGGDNSAHLRRWAVDLRARTSGGRYFIVRGLFLAGFRRVVLYKDSDHVHADCDPSLPQDVLVIK